MFLCLSLLGFWPNAHPSRSFRFTRSFSLGGFLVDFVDLADLLAVLVEWIISHGLASMEVDIVVHLVESRIPIPNDLVR
jgi:hypothetical protein